MLASVVDNPGRCKAAYPLAAPRRPFPAGPPPFSSYLPQTFRVHNRRGQWWKRTVLCARNAEDGRGNRHPHWSRGAVAARNRSRSLRAAVPLPKDEPGVPRGPPLATWAHVRLVAMGRARGASEGGGRVLATHRWLCRLCLGHNDGAVGSSPRPAWVTKIARGCVFSQEGGCVKWENVTSAG